MSSVLSINELLKDKLFQVIGSTPVSIAESLLKADIKNKPEEGAKIFAVSVFAAAVNKSTLETFLAEPRFATIRSLLAATLAIQGKTNMTALTLLGHCLLTTEVADSVVFATEFRRKLGQNDIWAGELASGSLSEKQRGILKEKKRVTSQAEAKVLGRGYLKYVGILHEAMTEEEAAMFKTTFEKTSSRPAQGSTTRDNEHTYTERASETTKGKEPERDTPAANRSRKNRVSDPDQFNEDEIFRMTTDSEVTVPADVLKYRREILMQSDEDIKESITRNGMDKFIINTRNLAQRDPDGSKMRRAPSATG